MNIKTYTVSQVNRYIRQVIDDDIVLNGFFIEAEISNFKFHSSGHFYFSIKDSQSALNCVMFKSHAEEIPFIPENGMNVILYGKISLYEKTGQVQFYAELMEPVGKGSLFAAFEQLKRKLEREGLFDPKHKRPIPQNPACIAIVTSKTGAAVHDIINVAKRRNPNVKLVVAAAQVQGEGAAAEIAKAIKTVNDWGGADVIIVGRGGGSMEDLWAFNDELVARAIFNSKIPVVSAVGHETDFTIADFAADLRAATPSAAAELTTVNLSATLKEFLGIYNRLNLAIDSHLKRYTSLISLESGLNSAIDAFLSKKKSELDTKLDGLHKVSPINVLKRGYSLSFDKDSNPLTSAAQVEKGDLITVVLKDGEIKAIAESVILYSSQIKT